MGCAQCGGMKKKKGGAVKKMQTGGVPKRNISKPGAGFAPETKGGSNLGMNIYGIPNAGQTGPNRKVTTETMQKGGSFAPNRAVQSSCKDGRVRDEKGRCVMARKMQEGGSSKFGMLSVKAGVDKNPKPTQADRIAGAKMQNGGEKPSAGLTKKKKSTVAKKASAGKDIGKKGKMFDKIAAKAGGGDKGKRIAAAAMWKNIRRG